MTELQVNPNKAKVDRKFVGVPLWPVWVVLVIAIMGIVIVIGAYVGFFGLYKVGEPPAWGQFGDFIGGVLNPWLTFCTVLLLVWSLRATVFALKQNNDLLEVSRIELELSRNELEKTNSLLRTQEEAISKQIETVQANARVERLATYANAVYQEIRALQNQSPHAKIQALREQVGFSQIDVWQSLDIEHPHINRVRRFEEWKDEDYPKSLFAITELLGELIVYCKIAESITGATELSSFYGMRLGRWVAGAVLLGHLHYIEAEARRFLPPLHRGLLSACEEETSGET